MSGSNGWARGVLGQLCSIEIGGTPSRNTPEYWDAEKATNNLWASIKDLNQRVVDSTAEQISDAGVKHSNVKLQQPGTILLSFKLTIGRVAYAGKPLFTNEAIAGLRSEELHHEFLYHGLQQWDLLQGVDQAIKGATLNKEKLKRIEFDYPPLPEEQSKIAEILSTVDRAIEQTEALIAKQQRIKTGLMQDLLTKGIPGRHRSFHDTDLGVLPASWSTATYGELASPEPRSIQSGPFGSSLRHSEFQEEGVLVVGIDNTQDGFFSMGSQNRISESKFQQLAKFELRPLDLLIVVMGASVGRCCVAPANLEKSILTKHVYRLTVDRTRANPYFLLACLMGFPPARNAMLGNTHGLSRPGLNKSLLVPILFPLPAVEEQDEIVEILSTQDKRIATDQRRVSKMRRTCTALMQDLLTGEKRVTPLLEPAVTT